MKLIIGLIIVITTNIKFGKLLKKEINIKEITIILISLIIGYTLIINYILTR